MKLKQIKKEWGIDFKEDPEMTLEEWLRKKGYFPLAEALKRTLEAIKQQKLL